MKRRLIIIPIVLVVVIGGFAWWYFARANNNGPLALYGNVDMRQVDLAFFDTGRISDVLVEEGDHVKKGEVLAKLDTSRLVEQVAAQQAQVAAQQAVVQKLHNGSRPQEIAQARANVDAASADAVNAKLSYDRLTKLQDSKGGSSSVTQSQLDAAKAAYDAATAKLTVARQSLALAVAGPRPEDIGQAEAQLRASQAQLALLKQQLKDASLTAPIDGIVRSRLLEAGEMTTPQSPVFSIAVIDPKWVRAYISEPDLPQIKHGMAATVSVDGVDGKSFTGRVGFISPVAEFTPRSIQTEELRTSLVYEVRVFVDDPDNQLRLGMPATVHLTGTAQ